MPLPRYHIPILYIHLTFSQTYDNLSSGGNPSPSLAFMINNQPAAAENGQDGEIFLSIDVGEQHQGAQVGQRSSLDQHWLQQAGTTCGASSQVDLTQNLVLKTRMLRFSRYLQQKCRKRSFLRQKGQFLAPNIRSVMRLSSLRSKDWGLRTRD